MISSVTTTTGAFAAIHSDGRVGSWGNELAGGNGAPSGADQYVSVTASADSFAALRKDGSIATWGGERHPTSQDDVIVHGQLAIKGACKSMYWLSP